MASTPVPSAGPPSGSSPASDFFVGPWLVRLDLNRLERGSGESNTVQVEPRVFQVLLVLSEQPRRVVTREALLDRVWSDAVVNEETLTRAISELRHALGDDPREPRFIETIRKGGYRLIAPVRAVGGDPAVAGGSPLGRHRVAAAAALAVVAVVGWAAMRIGSGTGSPATEVLQARPFTSYPGEEVWPAISADGSRVAFAWAGPDQVNFDIYVKQRNTETPFRLTNHPAPESCPVWSPDSSAIAFVRTARGGSEVITVPSIGGPERRVYAAGSLVDSLDWSPDGAWLVLAERVRPAAPCGLTLVSLAIQERLTLTAPPAQYTGDVLPAFSPDSTQVAFARGDRIGLNDIYLVATAGGEVRRLTHGGSGIRGLDWTGKDDTILFSSIARGPFGLWRVDTASGEQTRVTVNVEFISHPTVAAATGAVVLENRSFDLGVWQVDLEDPAIPRYASAPLIDSTREDTQASYSPDGQRIAFVSGRSGNLEVWTVHRDGSDPVQVTALEAALIGNPRWSPDGGRIAFYTPDAEHAAVFVADIATGSVSRLSTGGANDRVSSWSRDGRWLYVGSDRTGGWQVWKLATDGGDAVQVTSDGGVTAMESIDGRRLFVVRPDHAGIWELDAAGRSRLVAPQLALRDWDNWTVQADGLYFLRSDLSGPATLARLDLATGEVHNLLRFPSRPSRRSLAMSPDSRSVLYSRMDNVQSDLMVIDDRE